MIYRKKLTNTQFRMMQRLMRFADAIHPTPPARAKSFGIKPGMTVVDYGCGPGRYTVEFARLTGPGGKVFAVDLVEIALEETAKRLAENDIDSVELKLAHGYDSGLEDGCADIVFAVDMFHHVEPAPFLKETSRIVKSDGVLLISGGHQTRRSIKAAIADSGLWTLSEETRQYIKYALCNK